MRLAGKTPLRLLFAQHDLALARNGFGLVFEQRECDRRLIEIGKTPGDFAKEAAANLGELLLRSHLDRNVDGLALLMDEVGADVRDEIQALLDQVAVDLRDPT